MIACIGSDQRTARRAGQGYIFDHIPFVTDHSAVMQSYDMWDEKWNAEERRVRTTQDPIGWVLKEEHAESWPNDINTMMDNWNHSWKYGDLVDAVKRMKMHGATRAQ